MAIAAGEKATAARINDEIGAVLVDTQNTSGTATSGAYTSTLTGGVACGVAFTAPPSGKVMIFNTVEAANTGGGSTVCTIRVRTGASIGSGTDVLADDDNECVETVGTVFSTVTRLKVISGLTAGSSYNVQQRFRVTSGTGTWLRKSLTVHPTQ